MQQRKVYSTTEKKSMKSTGEEQLMKALSCEILQVFSVLVASVVTLNASDLMFLCTCEKVISG